MSDEIQQQTMKQVIEQSKQNLEELLELNRFLKEHPLTQKVLLVSDNYDIPCTLSLDAYVLQNKFYPVFFTDKQEPVEDGLHPQYKQFERQTKTKLVPKALRNPFNKTMFLKGYYCDKYGEPKDMEPKYVYRLFRPNLHRLSERIPKWMPFDDNLQACIQTYIQKESERVEKIKTVINELSRWWE